nr:DUF5979 domain-containing protein [Eubacterium sp.]
MTKKRVTKRVIAFIVATVMAISLAVTGGKNGNGPGTVHAESQLKDFTTINNVNFSSILGRSINYGILSEQLEQTGHMETTFATNLFINPAAAQNCDVDLAGYETAYFIASEVQEGSKIRFGKTYGPGDKRMNFYIETNADARDNQFKFEDNCKADVLYRVYDIPTLKENVTKMIKHAQDASKEMLAGSPADLDRVGTVSGSKYILDLSSDVYNNTTVYVNVEPGSALESAIADTDGLTIKKNNNTTVVFNVLGSNEINLNSFLVNVVDRTASDYEFNTDCTNDKTIKDDDLDKDGHIFVKSDTTHSGDDSIHNQLVDKEICQKIIWNVPNASSVNYKATAGTFVLPNPKTNSECVSSSAGWIASAGKVKISSGEWHYIYHGRATDINTVDTVQFHFAGQKSFTNDYSDRNNIKVLDNVYAGEGEYEFSFTETEADFKTPVEGSNFKNTKTDKFGKLTFPSITFNVADIDPKNPTIRYFVIEEKDMHTTDEDVVNLGGKITLEVRARNKDGIIAYSVYAKKYLTATDTEPYFTEDVETISGIEFTLGDILNGYNLKESSLSLSKEVTTNDETAFNDNYGNKKYKIAVKKDGQYVQNTEGKLGGVPYYFEVASGNANKINIKGLIPGEYEIVEDESDLAGFNLTKTIKIDGEEKSKVTLNGDDKTEATVNVKNDYKKVDFTGKGGLKITKNATGLPESLGDKTYEISIKQVVPFGWGNYNYDTGNYVQNINGTMSQDEKVFKIKAGETLEFQGLPLTNKSQWYPFNDVNVSYVVVEKNADVDGYKWTTSLNKNGNTYQSNAIKVEADKTSEFVFTNQYTPVNGTLEIEKSFKDANGTELSEEGKANINNATFTIEGPDGFAPVTKTYADFVNGKLTLNDVPVGTYTVTESDMESTSAGEYLYLNTKVNGTVGVSGETTVQQNKNGSVKFENIYSKLGSITLKKVIYDSSIEGNDYKIALINDKGKYYDTDSKSFVDEEKYVTVTKNSEGVKIDNLPAGTYKAVEDIADAQRDGYILKVEGSGNTINLGSGSNADAQITNNYDKINYSINITKEVAGDKPYSNTQYQVAVMKDNGYIDNSGNPSNKEYYYTISDGQTITVKINNPGEIKIVEKDENKSENNHYNLVTTYSVDDADAGESAVINLSDSKKTANVKVINTYSRDKDLKVKISKVDAADGSKELAGATIVLKDNAGKEVESWTSGTSAHEVTIPAGTYTLEETVA